VELTEREVVDFCTGIMYLGLFGANADDLRQQLGLPIADTEDDDNLRDHMGALALNAIASVEHSVMTHINAHPVKDLDELFATMSVYTVMAAKVFKIKAVASGVDFLTGRALS
jgi:hypothetical protein